MTRFSLFKPLGFALGCAALLLTTNSISAADIRANAGTTFVTVFDATGHSHTR